MVWWRERVGMVTNRLFVKVTTAAKVLAMACSQFFAVSALATPARLECTMTSAGADGKDTMHTIFIVFDAELNTLVLYQGAQRREFADVMISTVSINGATDDVSIGIDRSSSSIVVQTYSQDHVSGEFGGCRPAAMPKP
jgi:hypothetical protein